jgi:predicted KAP-like P-loop ATPase
MFTEEDLHSRKQWRRAQFLANCFWTRWMKEYLPMLQERQKWIRERRNLEVNDLVLVVDKKHSPWTLVTWPMYEGIPRS